MTLSRALRNFDTMRRQTRAIALVLGLLATTSVAAQSPVRWTDPTGGWSIDFVSTGWGHAEGLPANGPVLLTIPMQTPPNNEIRMCFVEQSYAALAPGADPAEIQSRGAQVGVPEAEAALPRVRLRQTRVDHAVIDGVAVAVIEGMSNANRFRGRLFVTAAGNSTVLSTISCISTPGMPAPQDAEIDTILATLRFSPTGLRLLAPDAAATIENTAALDTQLAEMLAIYREVCFSAFPDEAAVERVMRSRGARALAREEVRRYLNDDPGVGWVVAGSTAQFVVTVERPPFNTCAIRTMTVAGFPNAQPYSDFVAQVEEGRTPTPMGHLDRVIGNVRTRGQGDQFAGANGVSEGLLVFVSTPASGSSASGDASTEVRFARQIITSRRN